MGGPMQSRALGLVPRPERGTSFNARCAPGPGAGAATERTGVGGLATRLPRPRSVAGSSPSLYVHLDDTECEDGPQRPHRSPRSRGALARARPARATVAVASGRYGQAGRASRSGVKLPPALESSTFFPGRKASRASLPLALLKAHPASLYPVWHLPSARVASRPTARSRSKGTLRAARAKPILSPRPPPPFSSVH